MLGARPVASVAAFLKFSAGGRSPLVNAAAYFLTDLATQRRAAYGDMVSSAHTCCAAVDLHRQTRGHLPTHVVEFVDGKIDPKTGAARPTSNTVIGTHNF